MNFRVIILVLSAFFASFPVYADPVEQSYIEHLAAVSLSADKMDIWPGFQFNAKPFILGHDPADDEEQHLFAFNLQAKNPEWQPMPITNNKPIFFMSHDGIGFEDFLNIRSLNPFIVDGQESIAVIVPFAQCQMTEVCDIAVLMGLFENYEIFQSPYASESRRLFQKMFSYPYDEHLKSESAALLFLENQILLQYLDSQDQEDLKDYVAVYQHRSKLLNDSALSLEDNHFFGRELYIAMHFLFPTRGEIFHNLGFGALTSVKGSDNPSDLIREMEISFVSFSIPTVATILDELEPSWRQAVESGQASPNQLLSQHFHLGAEELNIRLEKAKKAFAYDELFKQTQAFIDPYLKNLRQVQESYEKMLGVEFVLPEDHINFKSSNEYLLNRGERLYVNMSEIDGGMDKQNKTTIYISYVPYYISSDLNGFFDRFKLSLNAELNIDGVEISVEKFLEQDASVKFQELVIKDKAQPKLSVEIATAGSEDYILKVENNRLVIKSVNPGVKAVPALARKHRQEQWANILKWVNKLKG